MKRMSGKKKIEEEYESYKGAIDQMVQEELRKIQEKANQTRGEAEKIGESVEQNLCLDSSICEKKKS